MTHKTPLSLTFVFAALLSALIFAPLVTSAQAAPGPSPSTHRRVPRQALPATPSVDPELEALRSEMQQQNAALEQRIRNLEQQLDASRHALEQAAARQDADRQQQDREDGSGRQSVASLEAAVSALKDHSHSLAAVLEQSQAKSEAALRKPPVIRYKAITFTPGGYVAEESVWRQHALQADIASPFNSIPLMGSDLFSISEFRLSARQTRVNILAETSPGSAHLSAFLEFDLLGAGLTSNSGESNSYLPRLRHAWVQSRWANGWALSTGQMWTLAESNRKGITPTAANAYTPDMIDAQYVVGFTWLRQPGVRAVRDIDGHAWIALSAEGAQTALSARNAPASFLYCSPGTSVLTSTVNYSFDKAPDLVGKVAFEPGFGHYEIKGLVRFFRERVYPNAPTSGAGAYNDNTLGNGFGGAASWTLAKKLDLSLNGLVGNGVGRYGTSQLPDVTVRPDGTLAPLLGGQGLATLDYNVGPRLKIYTYGGTEYAGRRAFVNAKGQGVGYGSRLDNNTGCDTEMPPSSSATPATGTCNADTRSMEEATVGFWYRAYSGEMGRVQYGLQYSWIDRTTWSGLGGAPTASENIVLTSVRYYFP
ncbi:MAG TPA: hypothetical protein VHZ09_06430 [Acidobacteriaceae bacterium]|nr:hypothetical protein [Acidobacteriaceae bacterium]